MLYDNYHAFNFVLFEDVIYFEITKVIIFQKVMRVDCKTKSDFIITFLTTEPIFVTQINIQCDLFLEKTLINLKQPTNLILICYFHYYRMLYELKDVVYSCTIIGKI